MNNPIPAPAGANPVLAAADRASGQANVDRMSDALRRYPDVSEDERRQLLAFLTGGAQEDIVRAAYVSGLEPRLMAFRKDHPEHFPRARSWVPFALIVLVSVLVILWRMAF